LDGDDSSDGEAEELSFLRGVCCWEGFQGTPTEVPRIVVVNNDDVNRGLIERRFRRSKPAAAGSVSFCLAQAQAQKAHNQV
jgi:hypothetical protein